MTGLRSWVRRRRPTPPEELSARIDEALGRCEATASDVPGALARAGLAEIDFAAGRPGRVRDSAFRLLVGDALLTYACEAALETDDPEAALGTVLALAAGS